MRGSVYYQTAQLTKVIFREGAKKNDRTNSNHEYYSCIASFNTMETYRNVWNNFFNYLKEHWKIKNCELITRDHVEAYIEYKIEYYPSKQYLEKISSALGKLEFALNKYSQVKYTDPIKYNFNIRQDLLNKARDLKLVANNYHNRVYTHPKEIISQLTLEHKIAASIQFEGGARSEGVTLIKQEQLKGYSRDKISNKDCALICTIEKGGHEGNVQVSISTYSQLEDYFNKTDSKNFKINYQKYINDIKNSCIDLNLEYHGSHGFRWTFAQNRVREYQKCGYSYEEALQGVSWEMKHHRANITEHYLG